MEAKKTLSSSAEKFAIIAVVIILLILVLGQFGIYPMQISERTKLDGQEKNTRGEKTSPEQSSIEEDAFLQLCEDFAKNSPNPNAAQHFSNAEFAFLLEAKQHIKQKSNDADFYYKQLKKPYQNYLALQGVLQNVLGEKQLISHAAMQTMLQDDFLAEQFYDTCASTFGLRASDVKAFAKGKPSFFAWTTFLAK